MYCWKSINYTKQNKSQKLLMVSFMTMLLSFIVLYVAISSFFTNAPYDDNHFIVLVFGMVFMYPFHKLLHYLPISHLGNKIKKSISWKYRIYPIIHIRVDQPISKSLFLFALMLPFLVITSLLVWGYFLFPNYLHYITILMAYQIGLFVPDFIVAKSIFKAPKQSFIEENEDGFEILIYSR